jgi:hypothetical protein
MLTTAKIKYVLLFTILIIVCATGCTGCGKKINTHNETIVAVSVNTDKTDNMDIYEFVDSIQFIKLQTTDDNLIADLNRVFFDDDKIIVIDKRGMQILIFDNKGLFIRKISKVGIGPGEYVSMSAGLYDPNKKNIIVYDGQAFKMLFYTLKGDLIREINNFSNNTVIRDIINLPNGNFLCYTFDYTSQQVGKEASGLWEVDSLGKYIRSFFSYETLYPAIMNYANSCFTRLPEGVISFKDALSNDLYYFEKGNLKKDISYILKNYNREEFIGESLAKKFTTSITSQNKGSYIFTEWTDMDHLFYTIYSKADSKTVLIYPAEHLWSTNKVVKPIHNGFIDSNNFEALVTSISGASIVDFIKDSQALPEVKNKLQEMVIGMNENEIMDMNPILQLLYIK